MCRRLLHLGAKWFDSLARYMFVCGVEDDEDIEIQAIEDGEEPAPSKMERRWVSVAWTPPAAAAEEGREDRGFWVAEFETPMRRWEERGKWAPSEAARVCLAGDMKQKCDILKGLGAKYYDKVEDYHGAVCLNAWAQKESGEFGPLSHLPFDTY